MSAEDDKAKLATQAETSDERRVHLSGGRTLTVSNGEIVELRAPSGVLELRVKITEEGPVLQVEGVKVAIKAADAVSLECKTFDVKATDGMKLHSDGELDLTCEKEMHIKSTEDMIVRGKIIHLN